MGSYRLIRKIAAGGMAEVFLAKAVGVQGFEKPVAIKRVLPHMAQDARFTELFLREARLTVSLQHANVVQVFDLGTAAGQPYMVLEFVDGENLRTLLRRAQARGAPIGPKEALFIVWQVCEGLAHAHERTDGMGVPLNLIHRDINPANVMVSGHGEVKLADFGIAKAADWSTETQANVVKGKPGYLSPEQVVGRNADQRSDLFLVGLLLYELLAGQPLFDGKDFFKSLQELRSWEVGRLPALPGVPEGVRTILARALEPQPERRYSSARALSDAVQGFLFEERMRVGYPDVAALFARLLPERLSPLQGLHGARGEELRPDAPLVQPPVLRPVPPGQTPRPLPPPLPSARRSTPPQALPAAPAVQPQQPQRPRRQRLGEVLLGRGKLTEERLQWVLERQRRSGGRLGELLVAFGAVSEDDVVRAVAEQHGLQCLTLERLRALPVPGRDVLSLVPFEQARRMRVLPLFLHNRELYCAVKEPSNLLLLDELKFLVGMTVRGILAGDSTLRLGLRSFYLGEALPRPVPEARPAAPAALPAALLARTAAQEEESIVELVVEADLEEEEAPAGAPAPEAAPGAPAGDTARLYARLLEDALGALGGVARQGTALGRLAERVALQLKASAHEAAQASAAATALALAARLGGTEGFLLPPSPAVRAVLGPEAGGLEDVLSSCCADATRAPSGVRAVAVACASQLLQAAGSACPEAELAARALAQLRASGALPPEGLEALGAVLTPAG